jgi:hypothetical protein
VNPSLSSVPELEEKTEEKSWIVSDAESLLLDSNMLSQPAPDRVSQSVTPSVSSVPILEKVTEKSWNVSIAAEQVQLDSNTIRQPDVNPGYQHPW